MILQCYEEYLPWIWMLRGMGIQSYVELGTASGEAIAVARKILPAEVACATIDHLYGRVETIPGVQYFIGDSQSPKVRDVVLAQIGEVDAVFIDADHRYEAVRADYETWAPITKKVVGFHDLISDGDVTRFVCELIDGKKDPRLGTIASLTWPGQRTHIAYILKAMQSDLPQEGTGGPTYGTHLEQGMRLRLRERARS